MRKLWRFEVWRGRGAVKESEGEKGCARREKNKVFIDRDEL